MSDMNTLNEIALNQREITHPVYGAFVVKRPTNRTLTAIDTAITKSSNRDLQSRELVTDPDTGQKKKIPSFLTKNAKMKLLQELGEWSEEDTTKSSEAEVEYRRICVELSNSGYISQEDLFGRLREVYEFVLKRAEETEKSDKLNKDLEVLFPMSAWFEDSETIDEPDLPEPAEGKAYLSSKKNIEKTLKDMQVVSYLDELDNLYKQYGLYLQGISAQSKLLMIRFREISLFADTIEMRADHAGRVAKIFYCTYLPNGNKCWTSLDECEDSAPNKLNWLLGEIEKLERIDPSETEEDIKRKDRFNFLSPLDITKRPLEDSHVQRNSKEDGESAEKTQ